MTAPTNLPQSRRESPPMALLAARAVGLRVLEQASVPPAARERQATVPKVPSQVPSVFGQDIEMATEAILAPEAEPVGEVGVSVGLVVVGLGA